MDEILKHLAIDNFETYWRALALRPGAGDEMIIKQEDKSQFDIEYLSDSGIGSNQDYADFIYTQVCILNFTLMLLNTKNIIHKKNNPPEKLNKKRARKNKPPLFSYHTLEVVKPGQQTASEGGGPLKNTMRLHFCRGHFRYYTKEKPLFGRLVGRFWIQPHVRGDKKKGVVAKDYDVKLANQSINQTGA